MPTRLSFRYWDREQWNSRDVPIPAPGDYLASDGLDTWIMRREEPGLVAASRVKWWRSCPEEAHMREKIIRLILFVAAVIAGYLTVSWWRDLF